MSLEAVQGMAPVLSSATSFLFLLLGAVAIASMMLRLGRSDTVNAERLRRTHRIAGWGFVALFCGMFVYMLTRVVHYSDEFSPRIAIHLTLAIGLACLLAIKVSVPRVFPNLGRHLFLLGAGVYLLAFPMVFITGGYQIEKMIARDPYVYHDAFIGKFADDRLGKEFLILKCSSCHELKSILKPRGEKAWAAVIDRMLALARPRISVDEAAQILAYLQKNYVPRTSSAQIAAAPIETHCLPCHAVDELFRIPRSTVGWKITVRKMSSYDETIVPPDKVDELAAYLVATQNK